MIGMSAQQTMQRADAYAAAYEPTGENPDLDSRVATYLALGDGARPTTKHIHARTLMAVVDRLPAGDPAAEGDGVLRGAALDEALEAAGLSKSGTADEKRARLAEHQADNG